MIVDSDLSQIEWRAGAFLSQDPVMCAELNEGRDAHGANCVELMELPLTKENRQGAKSFNFRMIYADLDVAAFAYYKDPSMPVFSLQKWKEIVEAFSKKYARFTEWHEELVRSVLKDGFLRGPMGHLWKFNKYDRRGVLDYNKAQIYNYPVQGTAGGLIKLAAIEVKKRIKHLKESRLIMMVHDSLVWDSPVNEYWELGKICLEVFQDLPDLAKKYFNLNINVPILGEVCAGPSWGDMTEIVY